MARRSSGVVPSEEFRAPELTDGVVLLNGFSLGDAATHLAGEDEEQARRFGWYPRRSTIEQVRRTIRRWQENWRRGAFRRAFAVREVATGELVGGCELQLRRGGLASISYWIFPSHRRRGFAARPARLACGFAFGHCGIERVEAHIEPDNLASRGVARRAGFSEVGLLEATGMLVCALNRCHNAQ